MTEKDVIDFLSKMKENWPETIEFETGDDNGRFVNLFLATSDRVETWGRIDRFMIKSKVPGSEWRDAMIITMTGEKGWDDYLLLHHFDPAEPLDSLTK